MCALSQLEMCIIEFVNLNLWSSCGEMSNRVECDDEMYLNTITPDDD